MKYLIWILIFIFTWIWLTKKMKKNNSNFKDMKSSNFDNEIEPIVRCHHCGVYIPISDSISKNNNLFFCSKDHLEQTGNKKYGEK